MNFISGRRCAAHENPFRTERLQSLKFREAGCDLVALLALWQTAGRRGAIVGPHGSGKTTLLAGLATLLAADGWAVMHVRLRSDDKRLPWGELHAFSRDPRPHRVLLLDSAGCLSSLSWFWLRMRVLWKLPGWIVTSHHGGLAPALWQCVSRPELFCSLARELAGKDWPVDDAQLSRTLADAGGNVREALLSLFDQVARGELPHRGSPDPDLR